MHPLKFKIDSYAATADKTYHIIGQFLQTLLNLGKWLQQSETMKITY